MLALPLAACGGGGIANIPPPPPAPTVTTKSTPLAATPGLTAGTYGTIALVEQHSGVEGWPLKKLETTTSPNAARIQVDPSTRSYTVLIAAAVSPYAQTRFTIQDPKFGQSIETTTRNPDGSTTISSQSVTHGEHQYITNASPTDQEHFRLVYDAGLSHVSYGVWSGFTISTRADGSSFSKDDPTFVYFVYGDRTAAADIPASGSATYAVSNIFADLNGGGFGVPHFTLKANFAAASISALFDAPPELLSDTDSGDQYYSLGFHASGAAPFTTSGGFTIALKGALTNKSIDPAVAAIRMPMTGSLDGAFFGPQASQVGGVFQFTAKDFPGPNQTVGGVFVGASN